MNKVCKQCLKLFYVKTRYDAKYCSRKCYNEYYYATNTNYFRKHWSNYYKKHKDELLQSSRKRYFDWKKNSYNELRKINTKAQTKKRFGVFDRKEILNRFNNQCCNCGSTKNLYIHHIDGNGRNKKNPNNSIDNLEVLCGSCHTTEHLNRRYHNKSTRYSPTLQKTVS